MGNPHSTSQNMYTNNTNHNHNHSHSSSQPSTMQSQMHAANVNNNNTNNVTHNNNTTQQPRNSDWTLKKSIKVVSSLSQTQQNYEIHTTAPFVDKQNRIVFCVNTQNITDQGTVVPTKTILVYDKKEDSTSILAQNSKISSTMTTNHIYCYHPQTHSIYIFCTTHTLHKYTSKATALICNMLTDKWFVNKGKKGTEVHGGSTCVCIGNTIYIFEEYTNTILIYEVTKGVFLDSIESPETWSSYANTIYSSASNTIFIMGGQQSSDVYELSAIDCLVSIKNKYKLPRNLCQFGCVCIEQCILIFGGYNSYNSNCRSSIYMFNVATCKWSQSVITTPESDRFHAVLLDDDIHLFGKFSNCHYTINVHVLLNAKWTEITQEEHEVNKDTQEEQYDSKEYNADELTVRKWLKQEVKLPQYIDNFIDEGYDDMATIIESMNEEELLELGITKRGHRKKK
eukprot:130987_1